MPSFTRRAPRAPPASTVSPTSTTTDSAAAGPSHPSLSASTPSPSELRGTRPCPSAPTLRLVPSGLPSLDDVLGGGLPLGSTLLLLAPDAHTAWGRLVGRHVAAQGLLDGGRLVVAADEPERWAAGMPWSDPAAVGAKDDESGDEGDGVAAGRTRIAWRYDSMGKFQTTVGGGSSTGAVLAANIVLPPTTRTRLETAQQLTYLALDTVDATLAGVAATLDAAPGGSGLVTRVALDLDGADWSAPDVRRCLLGLRALVRPRAAVGVVTLPPRLSRCPPSSSSSSSSTSTATADASWIRSLAWCADAALTLAGFGGAPELAKVYAPAHGLVTVHALPRTHHLLAPALRHSALLGVADGTENNLGFRLKRKRFIVETVHLGIEGGGSGERRTEPKAQRVVPVPVGAAPGGQAAAEGVEPARAAPVGGEGGGGGEGTDKPAAAVKEKPKKPRARVRFGDEDDVAPTVTVGNERLAAHAHGHEHAHHQHGHKQPTAQRVEIRHDRPDLYEF